MLIIRPLGNAEVSEHKRPWLLGFHSQEIRALPREKWCEVASILELQLQNNVIQDLKMLFICCKDMSVLYSFI